MPGLATAVGGVLRKLPGGVELAQEDWDRRHRWIVRLLWAHVPIVFVYGLLTGHSVLHSLVEVLPLVAYGLIAASTTLSRNIRAVVAGLGLMVASALLVHLSGGLIEMHFHFFVMLGVISLYQSWRPFLFAICFVAVHHAVIGVVAPHEVFDHPSAFNAPLLWAGIHAFFVLCASAASVVSWRIIEAAHERSSSELDASERRFRSLIEHSADVVTVLDADGIIRYDSPSCEAVLGFGPGDRCGEPWTAFVPEADHSRAAEVLGRTMAGGAMTSSVEVRARHKDGSDRWVEASVTNLLDEPSVEGLVVNFRDVSGRKALEEQLAHQAFHDPLTGLANRALLADRIDHAVATSGRRDGTSLAVVYLDLDDFKMVNDVLGHEAGDELLRQAAQRIEAVLRPGDTAARLGGDEFAVLLEGLPSPTMAYEVGGRLLETLRDRFAVGDGLAMTASIGIALASASDDASALLRNADLAMYRAKGGGKGRFEIYEAGMHAQVMERMELKADLRHAIDNDEFEAHYQPIVELATGAVIGVEALARWRHPDGRLISPAEFIPVAEETGMIVQIGRAVLRSACADAADWLADPDVAGPRTVSVNLSPRQIQDPGVVEEVRLALRDSGLAPEALILEVTESILVDDTEAAARTLSSLKALGVSIALDDFGTGYSSLTYLDRFPVDVLKIDKSFIDSLGRAAAGGSPLVSAIVHLGGVLGLRVTAEGIEGAEQLEQLKGMGCQQGQGYYFARPMPVAQLRDLVAEAAPALSSGG